jgi:hypothetical protein
VPKLLYLLALTKSSTSAFIAKACGEKRGFGKGEGIRKAC